MRLDAKRHIGAMGFGVLAGCAAFMMAVCAEEPASAGEDTTPTAEEVAQAIDSLSSLKDYQRLSWILNALDRQEVSQRSDLLQHLDARIDQLANPSFATPKQPQAAEKAAPAAEKSAMATGVEPAAADKEPSHRQEPGKKNALSPEDAGQRYDQVSQDIERISLDGDFESQQKALAESTRRILTVSDPEQRDRLSQRMRERYMQSLAKQAEEAKAGIQSRIDAFEARQADAMRETEAASSNVAPPAASHP